MTTTTSLPGHHVTVTPLGVFGRWVVECSCGLDVRRASKHAANLAGLQHLDQERDQ